MDTINQVSPVKSIQCMQSPYLELGEPVHEVWAILMALGDIQRLHFFYREINFTASLSSDQGNYILTRTCTKK